jgi:hypothetical protein
MAVKQNSAWLFLPIALSAVASILTVGGVADAYEIKDSYPGPDINAVMPDSDYKKLWGDSYVKGLHSLNWNRSKGWKGLVPGRSNLAQAFAVLGQPEVCYRVGWDQYCFASGISVWTKPLQTTIQSIEVRPSDKYKANFPLTMRDAKLMYGPIERRLKLEGDVTSTYLGRPGLTIEIMPVGEDDGKVEFLHFSSPAEDSTTNSTTNSKE